MRKLTSFLVLVTFVISCVMPPQGFAQSLTAISLMPEPGTQVGLTAVYTPAYLKGMVIDPVDPFKFDFIIYRGDEVLLGDDKQREYTKLIKYFLASLAVPDTEQWVNLSPYEQQRIIPDNFGLTEMGRDLLAQDYLLKQISSSLTNPDTDLGKKFWDSVYAQAYDTFGTTDIPTDTFNKIWITPDKAVVYEKGNTVYVLEHHLKVMLEKDYLATRQNQMEIPSTEENEAAVISQRVMKEVIIPAIEKEVNEGKNFAPLRQVYSGMLLASWYKLALKESILGKIYADTSKVKGVDQDPKNNEAIYAQYVEAFKKGVFNMIKEDIDMYTQEVIPRKYFSGGTEKKYYGQDNIPGTSDDVLKRTTDDPVSEENIVREVRRTDQGGQNFFDMAEAKVENAGDGQRFAVRTTAVPRIAQLKVTAPGLEVLAPRTVNDVMVNLTSNGDEDTFYENFTQLADYYADRPAQLDDLVQKKAYQNIPVSDDGRTVSFYSDYNGYDLLRVLQAGLKSGDRQALNDYVQASKERMEQAREARKKLLERAPVKSPSFFQRLFKMLPVLAVTGITFSSCLRPSGDKIPGQDKDLKVKQVIENQDVSGLGQRGAVIYMRQMAQQTRINDDGSREFRVMNDDGTWPEEWVKQTVDQEITITNAPSPVIEMGYERIDKPTITWNPADPMKREIKKIDQEAPQVEEFKEGKWDVVQDQKESPVRPGVYILSVMKTFESTIEMNPDNPKERTVRSRVDGGDWSRPKIEVLNEKGEWVAAPDSTSTGVSTSVDRAESSNDQELQNINDQLARLNEQREALRRIIEQSRETDYSSEMTFAQINEMQNDRLLRMDRLDRDIAYAEKQRSDLAREKAKAAVEEQEKYGGIDLNAANLDMQIKRDGAGVPLPISQQDLEGIRIDGLVPVILNIQPASSVPLFS